MMARSGLGWFGPTDGIWAELLKHLDAPEVLDEAHASHWLAEHTALADAKGVAFGGVLLVVLEHRNDPRAAWLAQSPVEACDALCLLGSDWHGHRRTYPVLERWPTLYWYQWLDRGLPWIAMQRERRAAQRLQPPTPTDRPGRRRSASKPKSSVGSERVSAGQSPSVPLRVQWILQQSDWLGSALSGVSDRQSMAWILSDSAEQQGMWIDALKGLGVPAIGGRIGDRAARFEPELIVIDRVAREPWQPYRRVRIGAESLPSIRVGGDGAAIEPWIVRIRQDYPKAFLVVVEAFPDASTWSEWRRLGVDSVVSRPCCVDGLVWTWQQTANAMARC
jgi:hypothetical protein